MPASRAWLSLAAVALFVEGDGAADALLEADLGGETEALAGPGHVEAPARLAVRLGGIPDEASPISGGAGDQRGQIADGDLLAAADVDGVGGVVALGGQHQRPRGVIDVEE